MARTGWAVTGGQALVGRRGRDKPIDGQAWVGRHGLPGTSRAVTDYQARVGQSRVGSHGLAGTGRVVTGRVVTGRQAWIDIPGKSSHE